MKSIEDLKVKRPVGIWILTIYLLITAGLVPLIVSVTFFFNGSGFISIYQLLFSVLVALGVIISAIGAWFGNKLAKDLLIVFGLIHYLLLAYQNGYVAIREIMPADRLTLTWGRSIRSLVYAGIIIWYFRLSKRTDLFYEQRQIS